MPVTIVQTNDAPFEPVDMDPITLDIIESAMRSARYEMDAVLYRTAMSPGIREQHDEFPMIANPDGKMVVGQFGSFIHGFKREYDGTIEEGDIFLTSDPYSCAGAISHAPDWLILRPVYRDGRLIAYASMFGHMTDVGGKVPGSLPTDANQIYEEGVVIPVVKIYKNDELQEDVLKVILHQCRMPQWNRSDFNALIAAVRLAEKRLHELCDRFGVDTVIAAMDELLERNRRAMLHLIRNTVGEDETLYFEDYVCDDGLGMGPYKMACKMWRDGDVLVFDFDGTDPQSESSINFFLNEEMFKMFVGVYMINVFDPQIMFNDGFYDHVDVKIPPGTLLKPLKPAALSSQHTCAWGASSTCWAVCSVSARPTSWWRPASPTVRTSCTRAIPAKASGTSSTRSASAASPAGRRATAPTGTRSGPRSQTSPTSSWRRTSRSASRSTRPSRTQAGPGLHRGGNGVTIGYRALEPGEMSLHDDRWLTYPWGVNGGLPGGRSRKEIHRAGRLVRGAAVQVRPREGGGRRSAPLQDLGRRRLGRSFGARPGPGGAGGRARPGHACRRRALRRGAAGRLDGRRRGDGSAAGQAPRRAGRGASSSIVAAPSRSCASAAWRRPSLRRPSRRSSTGACCASCRSAKPRPPRPAPRRSKEAPPPHPILLLPGREEKGWASGHCGACNCGCARFDRTPEGLQRILQLILVAWRRLRSPP